MRTIVLAGGCFWGMQDLFRKQKGVVKTRVGYTGGALPDPTYKEVKTGTTNHAEAIEITYEENETSLNDLFHFFFKMHNPTTINQQGNDIGSQYRSAIFYSCEEELVEAKKVIKEVDESGFWEKPIVTKLEPLKEFTEAEDFHQDYLEKNPNGYSCHFIRS